MSDEEEGGGAPGWIVTFADLMSLLMSFFVLLLSFSEMEAAKFKELAGSLSQAFGVQREIQAHEIPKGTSIIKKEFSPGKPDPTVIKEIRQKTVQESKKFLKASEGEETLSKTARMTDPEEIEEPEEPKIDIDKIKEILKEEIAAGKIDVELKDKALIISIKEKGSFSSGHADLKNTFLPVMHKIQLILDKTPGKITVSGHSDSIPISNAKFRSNWELSSSRAVSVIHQLLEESTTGIILDRARFVAHGYADTRPIADNNSPESRAKNRRVEIAIEQLPPDILQTEQAPVDEFNIDPLSDNAENTVAPLLYSPVETDGPKQSPIESAPTVPYASPVSSNTTDNGEITN